MFVVVFCSPLYGVYIYQCLKTPDMIKKQVKKLTRTTMVLNNATKSASAESSEAFSPKDFAHILHHFFKFITANVPITLGQQGHLVLCDLYSCPQKAKGLR